MVKHNEKSRQRGRSTGVAGLFFGVCFILFGFNFLPGSSGTDLEALKKNSISQSAAESVIIAGDDKTVSLSQIQEKKTRQPSVTPTLAPEPFQTSFPEIDAEPAGCRKPEDDYSRIWIRGYVMNQRTYQMLEYAAELYGGKIDITNLAITQGSFSDNGAASFGTHLGGGAVDLSVRSIEDYSVLYHEIEPLIQALRTAGFAAWLRDNDEAYQGTGIHIHAIAIGDRQLSYPAQEQLDGRFGYFRGYNGIPNEDGLLIPDRHGGPIVCDWMRELGYDDLTTSESESEKAHSALPDDWRENLQLIAEGFITSSMEETIAVASEIDYAAGDRENPSQLRAPLAAEILIRSGIVAGDLTPAHDVRNFSWEKMNADGMPWALFSPYEFSIYHFYKPLSSFDFSSWQLLAGDLIVAYSEEDVIPDLFTVSQVDERGRVFTVTSSQINQNDIVIDRFLLFDPVESVQSDLNNGSLLTETKDTPGAKSFKIIRRKGVTLPAGSTCVYTIRSGDTISSIADYFHSTIDKIIALNPDLDLDLITVGDNITIPVNITGTQIE